MKLINLIKFNDQQVKHVVQCVAKVLDFGVKFQVHIMWDVFQQDSSVNKVLDHIGLHVYM